MAEWATQGDTVAPDTMPMTQILTTAIDRMRDRDAITKAILKYLDTDLLCYRVKEPVEIFKRQKEIWDKWFTTLKIYSISNNEIIFLAPSKFNRDWIKRKFIEDKNNNLTNLINSLLPEIKRVAIICIDE